MPAYNFSSKSSMSDIFTFDGDKYSLSFVWNFVGGFWSLDMVHVASNAILVQNQACRLDADLLKMWRGHNRNCPKGLLMLTSEDGNIVDPQMEDGNKLSLIYVDSKGQ